MDAQYLHVLPRVIPSGRALVHNHVRPTFHTRYLGGRGFRAWLAEPDAPLLELCDCGFAPELGRHFRVKQ